MSTIRPKFYISDPANDGCQEFYTRLTDDQKAMWNSLTTGAYKNGFVRGASVAQDAWIQANPDAKFEEVQQ